MNRVHKQYLLLTAGLDLGVMHKRRLQEWMEGSRGCGHKGRGVNQKWTSTFASKFKYLIARLR